jgi:hypothetical protein
MLATKGEKVACQGTSHIPVSEDAQNGGKVGVVKDINDTQEGGAQLAQPVQLVQEAAIQAVDPVNPLATSNNLHHVPEKQFPAPIFAYSLDVQCYILGITSKLYSGEELHPTSRASTILSD